MLNHPSPPREPTALPCPREGLQGPRGAEGPGRPSSSLQRQSSLSGLCAGPAQEKGAFLCRHRGSQWAIHGVQEEYFWSCVSWEMEGAWAVGSGWPACWECPVPGASPPTPLALLFQQVKGSLDSSSLGPAHTRHSSASQGRTGFFFSALKSSPPLPTCNVPLIPGAPRRGGRAAPSVSFLQPFLLGQGCCGTLGTITRNFMQNTISPTSVPWPLPSPQKYFKEAPAAALTSGQT